MKKVTTDVFVYLVSLENQEKIADTVNILSRISGVVTASVNDRVKNLLAIDYDPENISTQKILQVIRENGQTGVLVGM